MYIFFFYIFFHSSLTFHPLSLHDKIEVNNGGKPLNCSGNRIRMPIPT